MDDVMLTLSYEELYALRVALGRSDRYLRYENKRYVPKKPRAMAKRERMNVLLHGVTKRIEQKLGLPEVMLATMHL